MRSIERTIALHHLGHQGLDLVSVTVLPCQVSFYHDLIHGVGSCSLSLTLSLSLSVTAGTSSGGPPAKDAGKSTMPTASARNSSSQPPPSVAKPVKPEPNMTGNSGGLINSGCSRDVAPRNSSSYSRQDGASRVNPVDFAVCSSVCLPALVTRMPLQRTHAHAYMTYSPHTR